MSSATRNVAFYSRGQVQKTPYCDVCFKKGMPPSQYQSHYPKSVPGPNGIVTCPTILAAKCNYCGKSGHWANEKYCSALRRDNQVSRFEPLKEKKGVEKKRVESNVLNRFAVLDLDSDEEVEKVVSVAGPTPVKPVSIDSSKPTWASMAKKPALIRPIEKKNDAEGLTVLTLGNVVATSVSTAKSLQSEEVRQEVCRIIAERKASGNYCSWMDSDSEEEEEDW
jgi:hypothetical protein